MTTEAIQHNHTHYLIYGLTIILLNVFTYATISLVRDFRNALSTLMKCLALVDIVIGAVFFADGIMVALHASPDPGLCNALSYVLNVSFGITTTLFGCISYDRYSAISHPDKYPVTKRNTYTSAWIVCLVNTALFLPSLLGWSVNNPTPSRSCIAHWQEHSSASFALLSTIMVVNMFVSAICYFQILDACMRQYHDYLKSAPCYYGLSTTYPILVNDHEKLIAKTFLGVITLFYVLWMPFMIVTYINLATDLKIPPSLDSAFIRIGLFTGIVKFVIYVVFLPLFRRGFLGVCCLLGSNCLDYIFDVLACNTEKWEEFSRNALLAMDNYQGPETAFGWTH